MELDSLQQWVEALYYNVKVKKEMAEYEAHLLDDITRPWPLHRAPQAVQDLYESEIQKQRAKEEEFSKLSEFDKELQTVENILQEAKLLKETGKIKKPKSVENQTHTKPKPAIADRNSTIDTKKGKKTREGLHGDSTKVTTMTKRPLGPNSSRLGSARPRIALPKTVEKTSKVVIAGNRRHSNIPAKPTSPTMKEKGPLQETAIKKDVNSEPKQSGETWHLTSAKDLPNDTKAVKELDLSKVKLEFNDVKAALDLPAKTRKLLATYTKLKEQVGNTLTETECCEETYFMKNMHKVDSPDSDYRPVRTLEALNHEIHHCIKLCTRAIKVVKALDKTPITSSRQHTAQTIVTTLQTLNILGELGSYLREKLNVLSSTAIVHYERGAASDDHMGLSLNKPPPDLRVHEDQTHPASALTYETAKDASNWVCKRLERQFLLVERDLIGEISRSYFKLVYDVMNSKKQDKPSAELIHILQNMYAVLADKDNLLPAYVAAD